MLLCQQSISDDVEGPTTAAVAPGPAPRNYQNVQPLGLVLGSTNPSPETPKDENERDESLDTLPKSPFSDPIRNEHTSLLSRDIVDDQFKEIFGGSDPDADTPFARALSLSNELKPKLKMCADVHSSRTSLIRFGSVQDGVVYLGHCRQIISFGIQIVKQID